MTRSHLLSFLSGLPAAILSVQWGDDHVFKVGGKMFAVTSGPSAKPATVSFKCADDSFEILARLPHIVPAPYLARAKWVYLERLDALKDAELKAYLVRAHRLIAAGLPKRTRAALGLAA